MTADAPTAPPTRREDFDVVVIGAGINGAAIGCALSGVGQRVLLVDQGDIGGGTSQASTMLIWGGLLYLKDFEFGTVRDLCRDRDRLIAHEPSLVRACAVRYLPTPGQRPPALVTAALHGYWLMGSSARRRPRRRAGFDEQSMLADDRATAWQFEEGTLTGSDARFVLAWVQRAMARGAELRTYARVSAVAREGLALTRLQLTDTITGETSSVVAPVIVNAAGPGADLVNRLADVDSPFRHALSRGVSIAVPRQPSHQTHLVFDADGGNTLTLAPWGPTALWASTESLHPTLDEAQALSSDDVTYLIDQYNRRFRQPLTAADVLSIRLGVRPVAVGRAQALDGVGLGLSRHHRLHLDVTRQWLTVYGGKLSGCRGLADDVVQRLDGLLTPGAGHRRGGGVVSLATPETATFPGLREPVVSATWARDREHCRTLDDYLRRRTNIAQWLPRGGVGRHDEHRTAICQLAHTIHRGDAAAAATDVAAYAARVARDAAIIAAAARGASSSALGVSA